MHKRTATLAASIALLFVGSVTTGLPAQGVPAMSHPVVAGIDLERATIPDLQRAMDVGRLSSVQLTTFYLRRIQVFNPVLHAVINTNPDALRLAAESDARRHRHATRGLMDGIPVLLKGSIDTADRQATTAGSSALVNALPARDAHVVSQLRAGGAVILGKANMSEWSGFRSLQGSSGWSAVGGLTANPYVLDRNPCGSSGGSAVAVSANLTTVAVGEETDGSIVCPSGANGIVGVKPSLGLVSRSGIVPLSAEQDTAGPMARNVVDAAILLGVLDGPDFRDPPTLPAAPYTLRDYTRLLRPQALRGKRIGVWRDPFGVNQEAIAAFDQAVLRLQRLGASTVDIAIPYQDIVDANEPPAIRTEFKHDLNAYLAATPGRHPRDLAELIQFNKDNAAVEMPFFGQDLLERSETVSGDETDPAYQRIRAAAKDAAQRGLDEPMRANHLDAIVAPTTNPAWKTVLGTGDIRLFTYTSTPPAVSGYPHVTVPMAFIGPLPIGISVMGGQFSEPTLLAIAYAFEQRTNVRQPPRFLPTIG